MMSSRAAVVPSVFQATPMPIRKSMPLILRSSKLRLGKSLVDCVAGRIALDLQLDVGIFPSDLSRNAGSTDGGRIHGADPHLPCRLAVPSGYLGTDIDVAQDPHTPVIKGLACHRQVDTSGRPDKQLNAEFALKRPDLRRQGRLGDMHPGCRPTEMELLGNRNEIADLAEFHGRRPYNG